MRLDNAGQAQILMASALASVMLTSALFALQHAQQVSKSEIRGTFRSDLRTTVEMAIKHASDIYRNDAACDPTQLNERLARMMPDGSIGPAPGSPSPVARIPFNGTAPDYNTLLGAPLPVGYRRMMSINVNGRLYEVSFGPVYSVSRTDGRNFAAEDVTDGRETTMDAMVEVWASMNRVKVLQRAVLINNCTYPCIVADAAPGGFCPATVDRGQAYSRIPPGEQPEVALCSGDRRRGDVDDIQTSPGICSPRATDTTDLHILRNYLRSGRAAGSCSGWLAGGGGGCGCGGSGPPSCADLNGDTLVDEADLTILEKLLRGYLRGTPI